MNLASPTWMKLSLMLPTALSIANAQTERIILVYFDNPALELSAQSQGDSAAFPVQVFPLARMIRAAQPEKQAMVELLRGPTQVEINNGYATNLEGLYLSRLTFSSGNARVWLKGRLLLKGALSGLRLKKQVERTLRQFPAVRAVTLYVNDKRNFESLK